MKKATYFIMMIVLTSIFFVSCLHPLKREEVLITTKDTLRLKYLKEVLWPRAYRFQDTVLLDLILDKSFELIDGNGNRFTKEDEINWIKNNAMKHESFHYEIKRLDIYKNGTAVIAGTGHIRNDSTYSVYQSSNVLVKKDTIWKAILSHVSGLKKVK